MRARNNMAVDPDKELSVVRGQATKALAAAQEITINTDADMEAAADVLSRIKKVGKLIKERKEQITRPLMESLNSARDLFKPLEQNHEDAERVIKNKMLAYQREVAEKNRIEQEKLAARVEKGTMKQETAIAKVENQQEVKKQAEGKVGKVTTRKVTKYRVVDESKLPREFLMPNMAKINEALKAGQEVSGAESYQEDVISAW